ncbi:MAG TPA: glycosyltransferase family 2 protein [Puia sp.]|nr:glycosyltransferase family 2 protein [Puia sp.]
MSLRVSIITATYNSAATIEETMRSVDEQDYPSIEHIIVDGQSKDDTLRIIEKFPHTSKIICEKDDGIYDAMNKGIQASGGDIIGILNSDDFYAHAGVISHVVDAFQDDSVQACYGDLQYFHIQDPGRITRTWKSGNFQPASFYWGWMPPHPTFFVRRSVYDQVGLFETSLRSASDYEMMLRILLKNKMRACYIPEVLVKMRTGGISNQSMANRFRANREDRRAWRMNDLRPYFFTLYLKPIRKLAQFFKK